MTIRYKTIADVEAITGQSVDDAIYLAADGREGWFKWDNADLSSEVASDTLQGIHIAPSGQNGSSGAWVRVFDEEVSAEWFGFSTAGAGGANSSALNAAATHAQKRKLTIVGGAYLMDGAVNVTGVAEFDGNGSTLDFSGRTSAASGLLKAAGSLEIAEHALASDAGVDTKTLSLSTIGGIVAGSFLLITSDRKDHVANGNESQKDGEWTEVASVSGSGPYTVTLKTALRFSYATADNAKVQIIDAHAPLVIRNLKLIGTGQQHSDGRQGSGDHGFQFSYVSDLFMENVETVRCNRNGFRIVRCRNALIDFWRAEFEPQLTNSEIQYGIVVIGAVDRFTASNGYCRGGRHGLDQLGDGIGGYLFNFVSQNNSFRDTYEAAIAHHSGVVRTLSSGDEFHSCGNAYDLRDGHVEIRSPRCIDLYNAGVGGECFAVSGNVKTVDISEPYIDNVRYIARFSTANFVDNKSPERISFQGGFAKRFQRGVEFLHKGGENPSTAGAGTYNTSVIDIVEIRNFRFLASPPRESTSANLPIYVSGYFDKVVIQDSSFEFSGVPAYYPILVRGARALIVDGCLFENTRAIFADANIGGQSVINGSGQSETRNPAYISARNNDWLDIVADVRPVQSSLDASVTKIVARSNHATNANFAERIQSGTAFQLTVGNGEITLPSTGCSRVILDTQGNAASDDLNTINGGNVGDIVTFSTENNGRDVRLKRLTGNIVPSATDIDLTNVLDQVTLMKVASGNWVAIGNLNNG